MPYRASFTVQAFDKVTVPAGDFDVVRLQGTITSPGQPSISFAFDLASKIGIVKATTAAFGVTETWELTVVDVGVHDLAITKITTPKTVTWTNKKPGKPVPVKVELQNRSPHQETIQDRTVLGNLVSLTVESLGNCPVPIPIFRSVSPLKTLPLTLKPKQKLTLVFDVTLDCANDRAQSTPQDPGHDDYRYAARVNHAALNGEADTHQKDDTCPRAVVVEPNPDGTIQDKGCGNEKPEGTFEVWTDVVVK